MPNKARQIWISWEKHRRTREICKHFGLDLFEFTYSGNRLYKYLRLLWQTTACILREKPDVLLVQNPSIVLALYTTLCRKIFGYRLIVDAHNEAVEPYNFDSAIINRVARFIMKYADFTIVTNRYLGDVVRAAGGRPIVLPDRLPDVPAHTAATPDASGKLVLVLIAAYAKDEPIAQIIEAVARQSERVQLMITGNPKRFLANYQQPVPANVQFTGFLPDDAYWNLLCGSHAIIDLTTKDNCLVCGAYEGVAAEVPLILSDNPATRDWFNKGVIYTEAETAAIEQAIAALVERQTSLKRDVSLLKREMAGTWAGLSQELAKAIQLA